MSWFYQWQPDSHAVLFYMPSCTAGTRLGPKADTLKGHSSSHSSHSRSEKQPEIAVSNIIMCIYTSSCTFLGASIIEHSGAYFWLVGLHRVLSEIPFLCMGRKMSLFLCASLSLWNRLASWAGKQKGARHLCTCTGDAWGERHLRVN